MAMCADCEDLTATSTRKTPPHPTLVADGPLREFTNGGLRADEQDYHCTACGTNWMHETGNSGQGWIQFGGGW